MSHSVQFSGALGTIVSLIVLAPKQACYTNENTHIHTTYGETFLRRRPLGELAALLEKGSATSSPHTLKTKALQDTPAYRGRPGLLLTAPDRGTEA